MSLPLTRRIAQAALLVAAGATPLLAAGAASATELVPQHTDLASGVSRLDGVTSATTVKGETHQVGEALGKTSAVALGTAVPAAFDATGATAGTALPETSRTVGDLGQQAGSTTATTGTLAGPLDGALAGGGAPRSMPPLAPSSLPGTPSVSGVDKVVNADTVSNPVGATTQLAGAIPATSSLSGALPATDRLGALPAAGPLAQGLPATGNLTGALPATGSLTQGLPATGSLTQGLPATDNLTGALPAAGNLGGALPAAAPLTQGLPATGHLTSALPAADALHLDQLGNGTGDSANRLGELPDLGSATGTMGSVTGTLQHMPSVS